MKNQNQIEKSENLTDYMISFLSDMIKAGKSEGGTSGRERDRAKLLEQKLLEITKNVHIDKFGNVCGAIGELESPNQIIWFIGHIDTVAKGAWEDAFVPKIEDGKLYGRGSSDQLAGVVSSVGALKILKDEEKHLKSKGLKVVVMGNPHEEDCEGESIKFLLKEVKDNASKIPFWLKGLPDTIVTTEPTSTKNGLPRPYFGHRGRYLYQMGIKGETGHASIPVEVPAAEVLTKSVANIFKKVKGFDSPKFGKDTYAFTTGEITSPSFNAHTEIAKWNIDFRIAPTSTPESILKDMQKCILETRKEIAEEKNVELEKVPQIGFEIVSPKYKTYTGFIFTGLQELPGPWLPLTSNLRKLALEVYKDLFEIDPPYDKPNTNLPDKDEYSPEEGDLTIRDFYNFSTDLTAIAQLRRKAKKGKKTQNIEYMGLGSGVEEQAHRENEWCPISSLANATAYYVALVLRLGEEK
ncbi:M20/M25/M40 family metallo-hydrolase [Candidatus Dojkabacteria bacterium]|nr:M20/M25/M40 family metallo-hydrolase [Candidatus Dojkabacteria bacterium]